jgi:hypothetical protein
LIKAGGGDVSYANQPLQAADRLQAFSGAAGRNEPPKMSLLQGLIRPFRTADMAFTGKGMRTYNQEIAELLADPKNLPELQKIAMFSPEVRKLLTV